MGFVLTVREQGLPVKGASDGESNAGWSEGRGALTVTERRLAASVGGVVLTEPTSS